jgi:hypothetical protein
MTCPSAYLQRLALMQPILPKRSRDTTQRSAQRLIKGAFQNADSLVDNLE